MNVVFILSDQHNARLTGCYGHPLAETPHMDRLAAEGTRFDFTYTNCPICVPARAVMFTGRYVFENGCWDNTAPWDGRQEGWSHYFRENDIELTTVGKLDFKTDCDHGIGHEINASHRGSFDIHALYREQPITVRWNKWTQMQQSGPRTDLDMEFHHDFHNTTRAIEWLDNEQPQDKPWVLNLNLSQPHPGWPCPPELWAKWDPRIKVKDIPASFKEELEHLHPYNLDMARHQTGAFADEELVRRCYAAYLAHIEMTDINVGRMLEALEKRKLLKDTLVIYSSDHGETCGEHKTFGKMSPFEGSVRVPLIMRGPGIKAGQVETSPVSHLDIFPTICEAIGLGQPAEFRGISLWGQLKGAKDARRNDFVFSEYHCNAYRGGWFTVSDGKMKYVEMVGERPMIFDLEHDPDEMHDWIIEKPEASETHDVIQAFRAWLGTLCNPQAVDLRAKADQASLRGALQRTGQLEKEIYKRGYEPYTDMLINRLETIPEEFRENYK
ncbi:sulfatase-like hydrolase/transferase [Planctomycetota bacterium]